MSVFDKLTSTFKESGVPKPTKQNKEKEAKKPSTVSRASSAAEAKSAGMASLIVRAPHVSEKASEHAQRGVYIFRVDARANTIDVRRAVEALYAVKVSAVRMINAKAKARRLGRIEGEVPGYKKAMVTLTPGAKINISAQ